jgi:hypothetical protein
VVKSDARQKRLHYTPLDYIRLHQTTLHSPPHAEKKKEKLGSKFMHR